MILSTSHVKAIVIKEIQDMRTNLNILLIYALPVFLTFLYQRVIPDIPAGFAISFGLLFLVAMVGMYVPSIMIAEEKEKKTLEVLLLSPATPLEVFMGKGLTTFGSMLIALLVVFIIGGVSLANGIVILVGTILAGIVCIIIGMIIGLLVQNQMGTGVVGTPIYLVFMLIPLLANIDEGVIQTVAKLLPTYYFMDMVMLAFTEGRGLLDFGFHIFILVSSIALSLAILLYIYDKRGLDG